MLSICYYCPVLTITVTCQQILLKFSNIKFLENLLSGSQLATCRQTGMAMPKRCIFATFCCNYIKNQAFHYTSKRSKDSRELNTTKRSAPTSLHVQQLSKQGMQTSQQRDYLKGVKLQ
jgi:hypothetical protein